VADDIVMTSYLSG